MSQADFATNARVPVLYYTTRHDTTLHYTICYTIYYILYYTILCFKALNSCLDRPHEHVDALPQAEAVAGSRHRMLDRLADAEEACAGDSGGVPGPQDPAGGAPKGLK